MYIMRVCKYYGLSKKQLDLLFNSLIMPVIIYGIELWGCAYYDKYLSQIDTFLNRAYKYGYTCKRILIKEVINTRDRKLWDKIRTDAQNALHELLPHERERLTRPKGHNYLLPHVRTERFKNSFINRCLFKFI